MFYLLNTLTLESTGTFFSRKQAQFCLARKNAILPVWRLKIDRAVKNPLHV